MFLAGDGRGGMRIVSSHLRLRSAYRARSRYITLVGLARAPRVQVVRGQHVGLRRWQVIER